MGGDKPGPVIRGGAVTLGKGRVRTRHLGVYNFYQTLKRSKGKRIFPMIEYHKSIAKKKKLSRMESEKRT